ncbi:MAG: hypothetical protein LUQ57_07745 [Methylococcaceae bacterium]|nr:hypothetical protein [Methylococcaceae bacterium]
MMNPIKALLVSVYLVFSLSSGNTAFAGAAQMGTMPPIDNTIAHLEAAIKAVDANEPDTAQEHMKAAGQSSKDIIGGSLEVKAQRGSRAIATARRQTREGDTAGAVASLKEAVTIFQSLRGPNKAGGRGGLK